MSDALPEPSSETPPALNPDEAEASYKRVSRDLDTVGKILRLHSEGIAHTVIAQQVGCHQTTVSSIVRTVGQDSTDIAKAFAKTTAYVRARRMNAWTKKRDKIGLDASKHLNELAGLTGQALSGINVGVQVVIGDQQRPAVSADSITVQAVKE